MQKFNVREGEVQNALMCGDPHDQLRIAYYLIIDNKRIMDEGWFLSLFSAILILIVCSSSCSLTYHIL